MVERSRVKVNGWVTGKFLLTYHWKVTAIEMYFPKNILI